MVDERLSCADRQCGGWVMKRYDGSSHTKHRLQGSPGGWHQLLVGPLYLCYCDEVFGEDGKV
jgi:hypothetical protein